VRPELTDTQTTRVETVATARLNVATSGEGFVDITREAARFLERIGARDGALFLSSATPRHRWSFRRTPIRMCRSTS
jgi:hypothetical protein